MKKNALIVCAFMAGLFSSCSNDVNEDFQEQGVTANQEVTTRYFNVIDENEVSDNQLFDDAVMGISGKADAKQIEQLSYTEKSRH